MQAVGHQLFTIVPFVLLLPQEGLGAARIPLKPAHENAGRCLSS